MAGLIEFLGSDVALVAAIAIAAYAYKNIDKCGAAIMDVYPITLVFAVPWIGKLAALIFYLGALYFLLPFLVGLGFPVIYTLMICLAYVYTKAFELKLEYGAAFSILTIMIVGTGI